MEPLVRLEGCKGVTGVIHAYFSKDVNNIQKALELGISCTGADDLGAYNIYFDDEEKICCEYMKYCITKDFKHVSSVTEAIEWLKGVLKLIK